MPFSCFLFRPRKNREKHRKRCHTNVSSTLVTRPSTPPAQTPQRSFRGAATGTHLPSPTGSHTRAYTAKHGRFGWGWYHYPRSVPHVLETLRGHVSERQTLPLLHLDPVCSRRTQKAFGTAMRLCASLFRGVAAPLGCVIFLLSSKFRFVLPAIRAFRVCETWGYHYPRRALRVVETPGVRLSKRLMSKTPIFS